MTRAAATAAIGLALALAAGARVHAQPVAQLLPAGSEIVFTTRQMGVPVEGRFGRFTAQVALDPAKPEAGRVDFAIDTASAHFGSPELDTEVGKPTWFDALRFAQASFRSSAVRATGNGRFEVSGRLTIKGTAQDIVVPVQITQAGATSTASGRFTLHRLAFRIGEAEWADTSLLADEVDVRFKLALAGLPPLPAR